MYQLLDPKLDIVFKKIFGDEDNKDITINFLNAVIQDPDPIKSVEFVNTEIPGECVPDKNTRLDIRAITDKNEHIDIEIQILNSDDMIKRSLFYWSKTYSEQLKKGHSYFELNRTICINVLNYKLEEIQETNFHNCYRLYNTVSNKLLTDVLEIHFIEIPKYKITEDLLNKKDIDMWTEFLKSPNSPNLYDYKDKNRNIDKAKLKLEYLSAKDHEQFLAEKREESLREKASREKYALHKAKLEGLKEGEAEGKAKGKAERDIELKNKLDELIKSGKTIEDISKELFNQ